MKYLFILILIFFFQISTSLAQDFWQEVILPDSISPIQISFNEASEVYLNSNIGFYNSFDEGITWNLILSYTGMPSIITKGQHEIFIGIDTYGNLLHSLDDGLSWDTVNTGLQLEWLDIIQDSLLFCLDWGVIYRSVDYGNSWDTVLATGNTEIFEDIIEKQAVLYCGSTAFLNPQGGGINQSLNGGNSWLQISLPGYGVSSFALDQDGNLLCGVRFQYYGEAYGVFRSVNNGYSWDNILPGYLVTSLAVDMNGGIYAGCDSDFGPEGVQFSSDNGVNWSALNSGLHEDASIVSIDISPEGYLYTITVFPTKLYRSINPVVRINEFKGLGTDINLFPNPCKNILFLRIINQNLPATLSNLLAEVYSPSGMKCLQENLEVMGNHEFSIDVSDLNKGKYYIRIIIKNNHTILGSTFIKY